MTYFAACAWCQQLAPIPKDPGVREWCQTCGHDPHERKTLCGCPACHAAGPPDDDRTVELSAAEIRAALDAALAEQAT